MAIEQGQVTKIGNSQNGKPWLEIGGKRYFAGRCDVSAVRAGQTIEFEWNEFGEPHPRYGRSRGLQNWALINGSSNGASHGANGHASSALDDQDRPAISNWVAHAIQAGHIKSPTDIKAWALASQEALQELKSGRPAPRAPSSSAPPRSYDMPPYGDDPPPEEPTRGTRMW